MVTLSASWSVVEVEEEEVVKALCTEGHVLILHVLNAGTPFYSLPRKDAFPILDRALY